MIRGWRFAQKYFTPSIIQIASRETILPGSDLFSAYVMPITVFRFYCIILSAGTAFRSSPATSPAIRR